MKPGLLLGVLVAGFVIGGLMCRPDRTGEAAQHRADSLAVVVDSLTIRDQNRTALDRAADGMIAALRVANRQLAQRAQIATLYGDSLTRALRIWADSMVPKRLVIQTLDTLNVVLALQAQQIVGLERASALADQRRLAADSMAALWRLAALRYQVELAGALKRANRRWGCTAGLGATAGISQYAAGLGVTCGRRL